eukprot:g69311.t1
MSSLLLGWANVPRSSLLQAYRADEWKQELRPEKDLTKLGIFAKNTIFHVSICNLPLTLWAAGVLMRRGVIELGEAELVVGLKLATEWTARQAEDAQSSICEGKDDSLQTKLQAGVLEAKKTSKVARVLLSEEQAEVLLDEVGPEFAEDSAGGALRNKLKAFMQQLKK